MNYQPPALVYATRTSEGIVLNVAVQGNLQRIHLPRRQAYHLMLTLMLALEQDQ